MRTLESTAERGNEANWDRASDPYYSDGPRDSDTVVRPSLQDHVRGEHNAGGHGPFAAWLNSTGHDALKAGATTELGAPLATNFVLPTDGGTIQDTGPGSTGDTIAGNKTTTQVLVVGAAAQTQWINSASDQDWFQVDLVAGHYYEFTMDVDATLDGVLSLIGTNGTTVVAGPADGPEGPDTEVVGFYATATGTYYVKADGFQSTIGQYTISAAEAPLPTVLDAIDWGGIDNVVPGAVDNVIEVYFCLAGESFGGSGNSQGWNAYEIQQAMLAFAEYTEITGVTFVQSFNSATADFHMVTALNGGGTLGQMGPPNTGPDSGVGTFWRDGFGWDEGGGGGLEQGGYGFVTLVHEIGHAMGMAHPHDNGGNSSVLLGVTGPFNSYGLFSLNQELFTIMSYNNAWDTGPNGATPSNVVSYGFMGSLGAFDIALMQDKYGANMSFHTGNDFYDLPVSNGVGTYYQTIWDAGGNDTIRYQGTANSVINLNAATIDYTATGGGNVSFATGVYAAFNIAQGVVIENATAGSGNDILVGNDAANVLTGNDGNDTMVGLLGVDTFVGGNGTDTVDYSNAASGVTANLTTGLASGGEGADTFSGIENLNGSAFDDTLTGDTAANVLIGAAGVDTINGGDGADTIRGGLGNDILDGGVGNDTFLFSAGDGADTINGFTAGGTDNSLQVSGFAGYTLAQEGANLRVIFDGSNSILLNNVLAANFTAADITFAAVPTNGNDNLTGTGGNDTIDGLDGNDFIAGGLGNDTLLGNNGDDVLQGGDGTDTLNGGAGSDTADYTNAAAGITLNLASGAAQNTGGAGSDTLVSVENVNGSNFNDTFTGSSAANVMNGGGGADTLNGAGGTDTLNGGDGGDDIVGGAGDDTINGGLGNDDLNGGVGNDTYQFNAGDGVDIITSFAAGGTQDTIFVTGYASYTKVQEGSDLRIVFDGSNSILLKGVLSANFTAADINIPLGGGGGPNIINGTAAGETLNGTAGVDQINGLAGDDTLNGAGDNDTLNGGDNNDTLAGGLGNDALNGDGGTDTVTYAAATSAVTASLASNTASGGDGTDTFSGVENLTGSGFNDSLTGDGNANTLNGGAGLDTLVGGGGVDTINGGDANDTITGGTGNDILDGGLGNDTFNFGTGDGVDTISGFTAGGTDDTIVVTGYASYTLAQEGANLRVILDGSNSILLNNVLAANFTAADINIPLGGGGGPNIINGTAAGETLNGTAGVDQINGLAGDDTLNGAGDADVLNGGDNNDTLAGGLGNDTLNGDGGTDTVTYAAATSAVTASLASNTASGGDGTDTFSSVENLTGSGFNDSLTGDGAANTLNGGGGLDTLVGGGGVDTINGGDANDTITGGTGNDILDGGLGNDTFNFGTGDGVDTISGFTAGGTDDTIVVTGYASYTLAQEGANLRVILDGSNSILLNNVLAANFTAADINIPLAGGGGGTNGTPGNDTLTGTSAADTINGLDGNDTLNGAGNNDVLNGGNGTDTLTGGVGDDTLNGGSDNDTMNGGAGNDIFLFDAGNFGADKIQQFQNGNDHIQVTGIAGVSSFANLVVTSGGAQGAIVTFPDGSTITMGGMTVAQVDASDFIFGP